MQEDDRHTQQVHVQRSPAAHAGGRVMGAIMLAMEASADPAGYPAVLAGAEMALKATDTLLGGPPEGSACRAGCPWCCYQEVLATVPEVLLVAESVRALQTLVDHEVAPGPGNVLAEAVERAAAHYPRARDIGVHAQWRLPCPVLTTEGTCAVYTSRPVACRAGFSLSEDTCKRASQGNAPYSHPGVALYRGSVVQRALNYALERQFSVKRNEGVFLGGGLHVALSRGPQETWEDWLAGKDPFRATRLRESEKREVSP